MRSKSTVWRMLAILIIAFLWGGGLGAYAANKAWVKYANGMLTFRYGEKSSLDTDEYWLNTDTNDPGWSSKNEVVTKVVFDPSFVNARPTSCYNWFHYFKKLTTIEGIGYLNTSRVNNMNSMFSFCESLKSLDVSKFNTAYVSDMSSMFYACDSLTSLDVTNFSTLNVQAMEDMFGYCKGITVLDLSNFNTMNVYKMSRMFWACPNLTTIYASERFVRVTSDGHQMFSGCTKLVGDIAYEKGKDDLAYAKIEGGYFTHKEYTRPWVKYADGTLTFRYGYKKDLGADEYSMNADRVKADWNVKSQDVTKVVFDQSFVTARPTTCYRWFYGFNRLSSIEGLEYLNTSNATNMYGMFYHCSSLSTLDLSGFNTSRVTDMRNMFSGCSGLATIYVSDQFVTSGVSQAGNGAEMFTGCTKLEGDIAYEAGKNDKTYAKIAGGYFLDKQCIRPWVKYADGTLIFQYSYKKELGTDEYLLNEKNVDPGWNEKQNVVTKVVFYKSFAKVRPTTCYKWFYKFRNMSTIEGIENLNTSNVETMLYMFYDCSGLTSLDVSNFNTSNVKYMGYMFDGCSGLTSLDVSSFNTSNVTDMTYMFLGCSGLTYLDVSNFNTSNVKYMGYMFYGCYRLETIYASDLFVTSNVMEDMNMFSNCWKLKGDISYDENKVDKTCATADGGYFSDKQYTRPWVKYADSALTFRYGYKKALGTDEYWLNEDGNDTGWSGKSQDVTKVVFDPLFANARPTTCYRWFCDFNKLSTIEGMENFNTSNVTDMSYMFYGCSGLTSLDLSGFNTSNVTDMSYMFYGCSGLATVYADGSFVTSSVTNGYGMFSGCTSLMGAIAYNANMTDQAYATTDGGYFLDKQCFFRPWVKFSDGTLTFQYGYKTTLGTYEYWLNEDMTEPEWIKKKNAVTKVVFDSSFAQARPTTCYRWFFKFSKLLKISGYAYFNTSNVTNMSYMFYGCSKLTRMIVSNFNTSNVTNMRSMFYGCSGLTSLNVYNFDTQNVTNMAYMFHNCSGLTSLDLSRFNTSNVTNMAYMFHSCSGLTSLNVYNFDTQNVTNMAYMFHNCSGLTSLDLSRFNTSNVANMAYMFHSCSGLTSLDVSFNTSSVTNMGHMFYGCSKLKRLDVSNFDTRNVTDMRFMFYDCSDLISLDMSRFNTSNVTNMAYMFHNCSGLTSLDISNFDTQKVTNMSSMFASDTSLRSIYFCEGFKVDSLDTFESCPATLYCSPKQYESFKNNRVVASAGNAVKPYVSINSRAEYGTLCVPVGSSLAEGSFTGFDKLYQVKKASKEEGIVTMVETKRIEPGVPYVYHRHLEGVDFESEAENEAPVKSVITFDVDADAPAAVTDPKNEGSFMKGTFESMVAKGGSYILQMDGCFHPVVDDNKTLTVGAYRAYLELPGMDEETGNSKAYRMVFKDGEATGIDRIEADDSAKGVDESFDQQPKVYFDLTGRKVKNPRKGEIYIVKGRKVVYQD